jgi:hypothetical protein
MVVAVEVVGIQSACQDSLNLRSEFLLDGVEIQVFCFDPVPGLELSLKESLFSEACSPGGQGLSFGKIEVDSDPGGLRGLEPCLSIFKGRAIGQQGDASDHSLVPAAFDTLVAGEGVTEIVGVHEQEAGGGHGSQCSLFWSYCQNQSL